METLYCSKPEDCMELTKTIHAKTSGNPFFFSQFLYSLYAEKLIQYSPVSQSWNWDIEKIKNAGFTGIYNFIYNSFITKLKLK